MNNLEEQVTENAKKINTTEYKMSIGEIINLYKDKEISIDPDFQRLFRWDLEQKSRLVESILIGIPLPSIFIQQRDDGVWDIIDGLQRLSTILEFVGVLLINDVRQDGTVLEETSLLPALKGKTYNRLDKDIQLIFKRFAINLIILKKESDVDAKYELFDRLNSNGSALTNQEIRQAIYRHKKRKAIELIEKLSQNRIFQDLISISNKRTQEGYDKELVLRFFAYSYRPGKFNEYGKTVKTFLDTYLLYDFNEDNLNKYEKKFTNFFNLMNKIRIDRPIFHSKTGFSIGKYEAIILGLSYNTEPPEDIGIIENKILNINSQRWFIAATENSSNARSRLKSYLAENNVIKFFNGI